MKKPNNNDIILKDTLLTDSDIVQIFYNRLNYWIPNPELLNALLKVPLSSNILQFNRLEFWGDSVLSYIITKALIIQNPNEKTGNLSIHRSRLVSADFIFYHIIPKLNILDLLVYSDDKCPIKNISNIFEILIALIFMYNSEYEVEEFIVNLYRDYLDRERNISNSKKWKTLLQELIQTDPKSVIKYEKCPQKEGEIIVNHKTILIVVYHNKYFKIETNSDKNYKISQELAAYILYHMVVTRYNMSNK